MPNDKRPYTKLVNGVIDFSRIVPEHSFKTQDLLQHYCSSRKNIIPFLANLRIGIKPRSHNTDLIILKAWKKHLKNQNVPFVTTRGKDRNVTLWKRREA